MIKGSTKVVGLIGNPVHHSFSPSMHNEAFKALGLDYVYVPFDVKPQNLSYAIKGAQSLDVKGLNVTIPHKISVIEYLDELDEIAKLIGAVNTIDFENMKGYNTDGIGAVRAIEEVTRIRNKNVIIAGAGGASRAISFYIAKYGAGDLTILNRNVGKAEALAGDVKNSGLIGDVKYGDLKDIKSYAGDADILINTTPIGMHPHINDEPLITADDISEDMVVFDAVYNPNQTGLLTETLKANASPVYGIKMLLYQGAESFTIWTGKKAPTDVMLEALNRALE